MRISELSTRTDVPIATLKYYLRESLLMAGAATGPTRSVYDERHVERVRLIRALVEVGGLSLAGTRSVIAALDDPTEQALDIMGQAHSALPTSEATPAELSRVDTLVADLGWCVDASNPGRASLGSALGAAESAGLVVSEPHLRRYAEAAARIADVDLDAALASPDLPSVLHTVVVGTVMVDPIISALRRLAQEDEAHRRLGTKAHVG